jgi:hypothetical protein
VRQIQLGARILVSKAFQASARRTPRVPIRDERWDSRKSPSPIAVPKLRPMKSDQIPYYAADGTSLGFRSFARALLLVEGGS